jgi:hypothetical protein
LPFGGGGGGGAGLEGVGRSDGSEPGVAGIAARGARRCPHSWQKTRWLGLSRPHVVQFTRAEWDTARGLYVKHPI